MNIDGNETTSKMYPDLNPTTPQKPQTYNLKKLTEIEAHFLDKIEVCQHNAKKIVEQFNTITGIVDTGLITSTVITGGISVTAFASAAGCLLALS